MLQDSLREPLISKHPIFHWKFSIGSSSVPSELTYSPSDDAKLERIIINQDLELINGDQNTFINHFMLPTCGWV